jgi:hypothetical protein
VAAIVLGLISAVILILTNTVGSLGFLLEIPAILYGFGLSGIIVDFLYYILLGLNYLALLGGWTVILGCLLVLVGRYNIGAFLMSLGAGLSLLALIWNLAQMFVAGTLTLTEFLNRFQGIAWVGAILSVIAQELVKIPRTKTVDETS